MNLFSQIIKDISTCKDGESYDFGRILGAVTVLSFLCISVYVYVVLKQTFEPVSYGTGAGGLFTGIGAHLKLKSGTEPAEEQTGEKP